MSMAEALQASGLFGLPSRVMAGRERRLRDMQPVDQTREMMARQVMMDNAPVGSVGAPYGLQPNPRGPTGRDAFTEALQLSSFAPGIGDAAGLAGDLRMMAKQPETRTLPNALMTLAGALPFIPAMTVFHGSPHKFDAFDMRHIGKGEGAQAYGHGLYFAENPGVARTYTALGEPAYRNAGTRAIVADVMKDAESAGLSGNDARKWARERIIEMAMERPPYSRRQWFDASNNIDDILDSPVGSFYEVDLPDEAIDTMLDFDEILSEQPQELQEIAEFWGLKDLAKKRGADIYGRDILKEAEKRMGGPQGAAEYFNRKGIKGIKYWDGDSRGIGGHDGGGTRNFVVFDDQLPKILKRE